MTSEFDPDFYNKSQPSQVPTLEVESSREHARLESDARNFLRRLEQHERLKNMPTQQNASMRVLVEDMHKALVVLEDTGEDLQRLRSQADFMDRAYRRLLGAADIINGATGACECLPQIYIAAIRAQEQFRKTISTISDLEEKAARAARRKAGKKRYENKGLRPKLRKKAPPREIGQNWPKTGDD